MDTEFRRSVCKGAILDAVNAAFGVANVHFAASVFRNFGMPATGNVRTGFSKESGSLLLFGFFGCNFAKSSFSKFFSSFFRSDISAKLGTHFTVAIRHMFACGNVLEIFKSIVSLVTVYVMHMIGWIKILHPTLCYYAVNKQFCSNGQIAFGVYAWEVKGVLSKDFSTPRYSVKMIKGSILDAIHGKANHGEPFGVVTVILT